MAVKDHVVEYIKKINHLYESKVATEHSYRSDLKELIELCCQLEVFNEQKHIDCGAPDLTLKKKKSGIPVAYIETKPINDGDLDGKTKHKEQFDRYKAALDTIVFTDYLDFHLYIEKELKLVVHLAHVQNGKIVLNESELGLFESLIHNLSYAKAQTITSASKLAELMANKAKLIKEAVKLDLENNKDESCGLHSQLKAFKDVINKDLDEEKFTDLYAQTIVYGLFAARLHDESPDEFTRDEARKLIPKTNPFLRTVFGFLAGDDINDSIAWIVDDLVTIFAATKVDKLRKNFEKEMQKRDPMIHFYEEFLKEYNPAAKKKYGVFYTPQPVVEFIVRAVDDILKNDFELPKGLADSSRLDVPDEKGNYPHRVQILDPATGTGTFLAEVVGRIKDNIRQPGIWPKYVKEHLLPRVFGFECMMAPYTIAHLKLDMLINLRNSDIKKLSKEDRVNIYLTNSLIEEDINTKNLFAADIAEEANKANRFKHSAPVMVMLGNPPYAVSSNNKGKEFKWIEGLLKDYKKNLNEKKINLDDDYIKFIRLAQFYVERTGEGIVAYISNNSFIDGLIHRQMRKELMRCFDDIYILDLHGSFSKKDTIPSEYKDENIFDIKQGVSINIFVKKPKNEDKTTVIHHYSLLGSRKEKYAFLMDNTLESIKWQILQPQEPNLFFVPKDYSAQSDYYKGFKIVDLMPTFNNGLVSDRDSLFYDLNYQTLGERIAYLLGGHLDEDFISKYNVKDSSSYKITDRIKRVAYNPSYITKCQYRPFDFQYLYYDPKLISRPAESVMRHINKHDNIALICSRQLGGGKYFISFCTEVISEKSSQPFAPYNVFPLYLYPSESELGFEMEPKPNLDKTIWSTIENWVKYGQAYKPLTANEQAGELGFDAEPEEPHFLPPEDVFDYIYGVLHSPLYREKYNEFLKEGFPRIPYPKNADDFEHYRACGHELRELHLMHNVPDDKYTFYNDGSYKVEKPDWKNGRVYINDSQYFDNVPHEAWEFFIGGYQPAQKWLKDRRNRTLDTDDINHYEKIIFVLCETKRIMETMDDPSAQVEELQKQVATLKHQLQESQKSAQIINYGTINNDNSKHITIK